MQMIERATARVASRGMQGMPRPSFSHSTYDEVNSTFVHAGPPSRTLALARALDTLLADEAVSTDEIAVFVGLSKHANEFGDCHPSQTTLANYMKRSRTWVNARIKRLDELGYIEKERRRLRKNGETSCVYYVPLLDVHSVQIVTKKAASCPEHDTAPRHTADTPCHDGDTEPTSLEFNKNPSLSAGERAFFANPGSGKAADRPANTNQPNANTAHPIQFRPTAGTCQMVPPDWQPSADDLAWAAQTRPDIEDLPKFTAKFIAKVNAAGGTAGPTWAKWRQWLATETAPRRRQPSTHPRRTAPNQDAKTVEARNAAKCQAALDILNARFGTPATIEIVEEKRHVQQ